MPRYSDVRKEREYVFVGGKMNMGSLLFHVVNGGLHVAKLLTLSL